MKCYMIAMLVIIGTLGLLNLNGYGAEPMMAPPEKGADPMAVLLMEQGIKQSKENEWEAARASFKLASQIDPMLSVATFNAGVAALALGRRMEALDDLERFLLLQSGNREGQRVLSNIREGVYSRRTDTGAGGFAEFGLASFLGFVFVFAIGAYEIGMTRPAMQTEEKPFKKKGTLTEVEWLEEQLARAA
jgi:tetratricopeptide (TPR) repeat protein